MVQAIIIILIYLMGLFWRLNESMFVNSAKLGAGWNLWVAWKVLKNVLSYLSTFKHFEMSPKYLCISICMYISSIYLHIFLHPKVKFMIQRFLWKFRSGSKGLLFLRCNSEIKINGSHYFRKNTHFLVFSFGCLLGLQSALLIWPLWPSQCRGGRW